MAKRIWSSATSVAVKPGQLLEGVPIVRRFGEKPKAKFLFRFSMRFLVLSIGLAALAFGIAKLLNRPLSVTARMENSFTEHAIVPNASLQEAKYYSDFLSTVAALEPQGLEKPRIVAAWIDRSSSSLHVWILASRFNLTDVTIHKANGQHVTLPIPEAVRSTNLQRSQHAVDFEVVLDLQSIDPDHVVSIVCHYTSEAMPEIGLTNVFVLKSTGADDVTDAND